MGAVEGRAGGASIEHLPNDDIRVSNTDATGSHGVPFEVAMYAELWPRRSGAAYYKTRIYFGHEVSQGVYDMATGAGSSFHAEMVINNHALNPRRYYRAPGEELIDNDAPEYDVHVYCVRSKPMTTLFEGTVSRRPKEGQGFMYETSNNLSMAYRIFVDGLSFLNRN